MEGSQSIDDNSKQVSLANWLKRPKNCCFSLNDNAKSTSVLSLKTCVKVWKDRKNAQALFHPTCLFQCLTPHKLSFLTKEAPLNEVQFTTWKKKIGGKVGNVCKWKLLERICVKASRFPENVSTLSDELWQPSRCWQYAREAQNINQPTFVLAGMGSWNHCFWNASQCCHSNINDGNFTTVVCFTHCTNRLADSTLEFH